MELTLLLSLLGLITAVSIFVLVRNHLLHLSYTLFWLFIAFIVLILAFWPSLNLKLAKALGVQYAPILPVIVAILLLFIKSLKQDIEITKKEQQIHRLIQELSILKSEIGKNNQHRGK